MNYKIDPVIVEGHRLYNQWLSLVDKPTIVGDPLSHFLKVAEESMCGYIATYNGNRVEVKAASLYAAKQEAIKLLRVPRSKQGLLSVTLAEVDDRPVIHSPAEF